MDDEELTDRVDTVTATATKKKPTEQYGNIVGGVEATAAVLEGDDADEVLDALNEWVVEQNELHVAKRYEQFLRQDDE